MWRKDIEHDHVTYILCGDKMSHCHPHTDLLRHCFRTKNWKVSREMIRYMARQVHCQFSADISNQSARECASDYVVHIRLSAPETMVEFRPRVLIGTGNSSGLANDEYSDPLR